MKKKDINVIESFLKKIYCYRRLSKDNFYKKKFFAENNFLISPSVALNYNMYVSALKKKKIKKNGKNNTAILSV